ALEVGRELCLAAVHDRPFDVGLQVHQLAELALRLRPSPATSAVLRAAEQRKIPVRRLNGDGLLQLGQGARQRRIWAAQTDRTSALSESIARDIELTRNMLESAGIPVH